MTTPRVPPKRFLLLLRDEDHGDQLASFGLRCDRAEILATPPSGPLPDALGDGEPIE